MDARLTRWWMDRPPLTTQDEAASYIADLGFVVLFGDAEATLPSLREVARDDDAPRLDAGWNEDLERVWTWKDELPLEGLAWCGRFVAGRQSLVSPALLALLREDGAEAQLTPVSRKVFDHVRSAGPTSMRTIRRQFGLDSRGGQKVLGELGQALLVSNFGTVQDGPGWASCVIELTARAFPGRDERPVADRRRDAALVFLSTMVHAEPKELARAFRWPRRDAAAILTELTEADLARLDGAGSRYRLV
jgi:hypothetical protein